MHVFVPTCQQVSCNRLSISWCVHVFSSSCVSLQRKWMESPLSNGKWAESESLTRSRNERLTVADSFKRVLEIEMDGREVFTNDENRDGGGKYAA